MAEQQGYGLSKLTGGFFDTYFKAKQLRQREDQFNKQMAEEQRQSSLLNEYRMATLQAKQPTTEYQNFSQEGYYKVEPGKEPTYIQNQNRPTSTPEVTTTPVRQGNKFVTYAHQKGIDPTEGKVIGESPIREGSSGANESPELLEDWKPTALVISLGKSKKIYPYSEVGMSRLIDDITKDKKLSMYAKKLIKENNIQDSETLSREIARHTQNKWYQGGKGFTDEQIMRLDKLTEVFGQFVEKRNELGR